MLVCADWRKTDWVGRVLGKYRPLSTLGLEKAVMPQGHQPSLHGAEVGVCPALTRMKRCLGAMLFPRCLLGRSSSPRRGTLALWLPTQHGLAWAGMGWHGSSLVGA
jgi:hypothetical protein